MRKLDLESLSVDSFATASVDGPIRGTVLGQALLNTGTGACPVSYGGTCVISCRHCDRADDFAA